MPWIALWVGLGGAWAGPAAPPIVPAPPVPAPRPVPGSPRACAAIEADARALLADAAACADACVVVSLAEGLPGSCVAGFQCAVALSADLDLPSFLAAARALDAEKRACGACAQAACRPPGALDARCVDGLCVLVPAAPLPEREARRGADGAGPAGPGAPEATRGPGSR